MSTHCSVQLCVNLVVYQSFVLFVLLKLFKLVEARGISKEVQTLVLFPFLSLPSSFFLSPFCFALSLCLSLSLLIFLPSFLLSTLPASVPSSLPPFLPPSLHPFPAPSLLLSLSLYIYIYPCVCALCRGAEPYTLQFISIVMDVCEYSHYRDVHIHTHMFLHKHARARTHTRVRPHPHPHHVQPIPLLTTFSKAIFKAGNQSSYISFAIFE